MATHTTTNNTKRKNPFRGMIVGHLAESTLLFTLVTALILMFFGLGIIGVLASYLSATFLSRQQRRRAQPAGENEQDKDHDEDEEHAEEETLTNLEAELAAMKEELAGLKKLLEERYQAQ